MDEIGFLPQYRGRCVHDGWPSYTFYPKCRHALCGAHLLRELVYFKELGVGMKAWATPLKELLLEMKADVERVSAEDGQRLAAQQLTALTESYERLIAERLQVPLPPGLPEQIRKQAGNLLLWMQRRKEEVLRFLMDCSVPFDSAGETGCALGRRVPRWSYSSFRSCAPSSNT